MSKHLPKKPGQGRTLYEQIRIVAKNRNWPDCAAHDAANKMVRDVGNTKVSSINELKTIVDEALRVD